MNVFLVHSEDRNTVEFVEYRNAAAVASQRFFSMSGRGRARERDLRDRLGLSVCFVGFFVGRKI